MSANKTYQAFSEKLGGTHVEDFIGDPGMLFWNPETGELRIGTGTEAGGISLFKALASNFGLSADGGNTITNDFSVITYDGGNATSPLNVYDTLDGNTTITDHGFSANDQYNFTNTIVFSNTVTINGIKAGGGSSLGSAGQVLTSTGYNTVWGNPSIANNTTLKFDGINPSIVSDNSDATVNVANGASYLIDNFSGMLLVNDHYDGGVALYIAGGGYSALVSNTRSAFDTSLPMQDNGYKWVNSTNLTGPFTFTVIKTRSGS